MEKKVFADGFCFKKAFLLFVAGCIIGNYYEQILNLITHFYQDGTIFWEFRRGVIYGPFNPVYGVGMLLFVLLLKKFNNIKTFLYGSLIGGIFEYLINYFQELIVGTSSWNYSGYFLNINGRTTIPFMLFWGLGALFTVKIFYPWFSKLIEKIPYKIGNIIYKFLFVFLIFDMIISFTALLRQNLRRHDVPAYTFVGIICDKIYTDEVLHYYFPNMVESK